MSERATPTTESILAWHFLPANRTLVNGDGREVRVGETLTVAGPLKLCERGLHASERAIDAVKFAPGLVVCRVRLSGEILRGDDKLCATERTVLAMADATAVLHEFACRCAEQALRLAGVEDQRCWNAIETKRRWLRGEATGDELTAAWWAAREAAWEAAREAAWWAAWEAAWEAAREAAWDAAWWAAWDAAWWAAREAAWEAAREAAWDAAREAQNTLLTSMLSELLETAT